MNEPFSWDSIKKRAISKKIDRAIILMGLNQGTEFHYDDDGKVVKVTHGQPTGNPTYRVNHNFKTKDEVRIKLTDEISKKQKMVEDNDRRTKAK